MSHAGRVSSVNTLNETNKIIGIQNKGITIEEKNNHYYPGSHLAYLSVSERC